MPSHPSAPAGRRAFVTVGTTCLSYLDFPAPEGTPVLVALHGHFGCARNFAPLAADLAQAGWHVLALDQRGHGWSDHPAGCRREDYVADAIGFIEQAAGGTGVVLLGHSLGGVNAYQVAARRPDLVSALIVEDIGARVAPVVPFALDWPHRFPCLDALLAHLADRGLSGDRHFLDSIHETADGWGFRFDPQWIRRSQECLTGDWSTDWQASACPALLIHGTRSWAVTTEEIERMATIRPNTHVVRVDAGHTVHDEDPATFKEAIYRFLRMPSAAEGKIRTQPHPSERSLP